MSKEEVKASKESLIIRQGDLDSLKLQSTLEVPSGDPWSIVCFLRGRPGRLTPKEFIELLTKGAVTASHALPAELQSRKLECSGFARVARARGVE
jgi:hypothetical protein